MYFTPIYKVKNVSSHYNIYIKREDFIPFSFGGNKVRIAEEFFADMDRKNKNCIISYGNARSNLNRAIANMAFSKSIPCYIISPADDDGTRTATANSVLVESCNAIVRECTKQNVAATVEMVFSECESAGYHPYYIYGDKYGKGNERTPVNAYVKTYGEILRQEHELGLEFDYIFCATGTGMTQAGLICGQCKYGGRKEIVGISVAREANKESEIIKTYCNSYLDSTDVEAAPKVQVNDDCLSGGYGKYSNDIESTIMRMYRCYGIPLDPTYTGKAFFGMDRYMENNRIEDKNVLFIHTGGTPLFFDYIRDADKGVHNL